MEAKGIVAARRHLARHLESRGAGEVGKKLAVAIPYGPAGRHHTHSGRETRAPKVLTVQLCARLGGLPSDHPVSATEARPCLQDRGGSVPLANIVAVSLPCVSGIDEQGTSACSPTKNAEQKPEGTMIAILPTRPSLRWSALTFMAILSCTVRSHGWTACGTQNFGR